MWGVRLVSAFLSDWNQPLLESFKYSSQRITRWPEFVRDSRDAYGYTTVRVRLAPAAPEAISRLDETLDWLCWPPPAAQRILWSRANGLSWRRIAVFAGKSPNTCRAWYLAALRTIAARLNGNIFASPTGGAKFI